MSDTGQSSDAPANVAFCDVCIVGAGIAGLNALFVASQYLSAGQKVILVDRRPGVGGMWVDTYPYVRLHQPHALFTAGNIKWTLGKDRSYLATKDEVLDHFRHCLSTIKQRVGVKELFGWTMESEQEAGGKVRVTCVSGTGRRLVIETARLIKAYGLRVVPNEPLAVSSGRVHSVSPDSCDVRSGELRSDDAPVWIVGSGKTAMDTAHALIAECPGREVNLVAGSGTYFLSRDRLLPAGARRWWAGALLSGIGTETARRFDGTNEKEVTAWFRSAYGTWLTPETGNFLLGLLSESENTAIAAGLTEVVMDHLADVVDRDGQPHLVFRGGAAKAIRPGSWIVNCTGYVFRRDHPYEPYVSDNGAVLSIQLRSATLHLSTYMSYFMTHLMMLNKLGELPLYEVDFEQLRRKANAAFPYTVFALLQYNLSLIADAVPLSVFRDCGIDTDRWFPLHRRLMGTARFALTHHRERPHCRATLDTVRDRFQVRCGPLNHAAAAL